MLRPPPRPTRRRTLFACTTLFECFPLVIERFALVLVATKRTRQLMAGARPLQPNTKNKAPVLSLRAIAAELNARGMMTRE